MLKILGLIVAILVLVVILNPKGESVSGSSTSYKKEQVNSVKNPYLEKYAGGYIIEVKGIPNIAEGELYVLHANGNVKWMWIEVSGGDSKVLSEKTGKWNATHDKIIIEIKGITGVIKEEYVLTNGIFKYGDRSLKRSE